MWKGWMFRAIAIIIALLLVDLFVCSITGTSPVETTSILCEGVFGNVFYVKGTYYQGEIVHSIIAGSELGMNSTEDGPIISNIIVMQIYL